MQYLFIDTASNTSVALVDTGTDTVQTAQVSDSRSQVEKLGSLVVELIDPKNPPQLIIVSTGPGPFTGLRVGLVTARSLGLAWDVPVLGVDELFLQAQAYLRTLLRVEGTAHPAGTHTPDWMVSCLDARRHEVYVGVFRVLPPTDSTPSATEQLAPVEAPLLEQVLPDWVGSASDLGGVIAQQAPQFPGLESPGVAVVGNASERLTKTPAIGADLAELARTSGVLVGKNLGVLTLAELDDLLKSQNLRQADAKWLELHAVDTQPQYLRRPDIHHKQS